MPPDLPLTTGPTAARAQHQGIEHLLSGSLEAAADAFRAAVTEDPCFAVGHACLALALSALDPEERDDAVAALTKARRCSRRLSRRERHQVEVVVLALDGRLARASALAQEHLDEFPDDELTRYVLLRWCGDGGGASAQ